MTGQFQYLDTLDTCKIDLALLDCLGSEKKVTVYTVTETETNEETRKKYATAVPRKQCPFVTEEPKNVSLMVFIWL